MSSSPQISVFLTLQKMGFFSPTVKFNTAPGRTVSLWLGWIGFSLMVMMNIYSMRKRFDFMQGMGRLSAYLNFHIFCGLMGPTLIFFHCGLKVRGLVAISFWSMIISLASGIVGRYFFVQLSSKKDVYESAARKALERLDYLLQKRNYTWSPNEKDMLLTSSLAHVGGFTSDSVLNSFSVFWKTLVGDLRLLFSDIPVAPGFPQQAKAALTVYAMNKRRASTIAPFERLMGYWHTFHFPFAVFMYLAAIVHIVSSLIFLGS